MLIHSCNKPEIGEFYLKEMIENKIKPNTWVFNSVISLYKNDFSKAVEIMEVEMPKYNLVPDVVTYNYLINYSNNFDIALALFIEMCSKKIVPNNYIKRAMSLKVGDSKENESLFNEAWYNYAYKNPK